MENTEDIKCALKTDSIIRNLRSELMYHLGELIELLGELPLSKVYNFETDEETLTVIIEDVKAVTSHVMDIEISERIFKKIR